VGEEYRSDIYREKQWLMVTENTVLRKTFGHQGRK
jgi:hypothetical protein